MSTIFYLAMENRRFLDGETLREKFYNSEYWQSTVQDAEFKEDHDIYYLAQARVQVIQGSLHRTLPTGIRVSSRKPVEIANIIAELTGLKLKVKPKRKEKQKLNDIFEKD